MSDLKRNFIKILGMHMKGTPPVSIARELNLPLVEVFEAISSVHGFTKEQINDYCIILGLETLDEVMEWRDAVGEEQALYGAALVSTATMNLIDFSTQLGDYKEAKDIIDRIKQ